MNIRKRAAQMRQALRNLLTTRASHSRSYHSLLITRQELWQEIGRLSYGHRPHLSSDPHYLKALETRGKEICSRPDGHGIPEAAQLITQAREIEERLTAPKEGDRS